MIDRRLNYGRHLINKYTLESGKTVTQILDLGAGFGDDLLIAKTKHPSANLHAVECYGPYQKILAQKGINVHNCNIEKDALPFQDESVDMIICNQIFEHCKEIWWIMHEISRVLKKGGVLIIGVPNLASLHNRFLLLIGRQPTSIQNHTAHLRGYSKNDLIKFINEGSNSIFSLDGFGGSNFYPFPPFIAKPLAAVLPGMAWGIFLKFRKNEQYNGSFLTYPIEKKLETNFYLGE